MLNHSKKTQEPTYLFSSMLNKEQSLLQQAVVVWENLIQEGVNTSWQGWDPYDALESSVIRRITSKNNWLALSAVQFMRISPINIRSLLKVEKRLDLKALTLFASALLLRWRQMKKKSYRSLAEEIIKRIVSNQSPKVNNFAVTQNRELQMLYYRSHAGNPGHFLTLLAGKAFLLASEFLNDKYYEELSLSIGDYFTTEAPKTWNDHKLFFHYNTNLQVKNQRNVRVFNMSALIGAFLLQLWKKSRKNLYFEQGKAAVEYILDFQADDGSWPYSDKVKYVDTFHLIFIIWALLDAEEALQTAELEEPIEKAVAYLESHLLEKTGNGIRPKRFDPRFPIPTAQRIAMVDIRDVALNIFLNSRLAKRRYNRKDKYLQIASETLHWAIKNFYNGKNFFYEKTKYWTNRTSYLSLQGWMALALSEYFGAVKLDKN